MTTPLTPERLSSVLLTRNPGEELWRPCYVELDGANSYQLTVLATKPSVTTNEQADRLFLRVSEISETSKMEDSPVPAETVLLDKLPDFRDKWLPMPNVQEEIFSLNPSTRVDYLGFGREFSLTTEKHSETARVTNIFLCQSVSEAAEWESRLKNTVAASLNEKNARTTSDQWDVVVENIGSVQTFNRNVANQRSMRGPKRISYKSSLVSISGTNLRRMSDGGNANLSRDINVEATIASSRRPKNIRDRPDLLLKNNRLIRSDRGKNMDGDAARRKLVAYANNSKVGQKFFSEHLVTRDQSGDALFEQHKIDLALPEVLTNENDEPLESSLLKTEATSRFLRDVLDGDLANTNEAVASLSRMLFKDLDDSALDRLVKNMYRIDADKHEQVVQLDQTWDQFCIVQSGSFDLRGKPVKNLDAPLDRPLQGKIEKRLKMGDSFGNRCLLQSVKGEFSVKCVAPGVIWGLKRKKFQRIARENNIRFEVWQQKFLIALFADLEPGVNVDLKGEEENRVMALMRFEKVREEAVVPPNCLVYVCKGKLAITDETHNIEFVLEGQYHGMESLKGYDSNKDEKILKAEVNSSVLLIAMSELKAFIAPKIHRLQTRQTERTDGILDGSSHTLLTKGNSALLHLVHGLLVHEDTYETLDSEEDDPMDIPYTSDSFYHTRSMDHVNMPLNENFRKFEPLLTYEQADFLSLKHRLQLGHGSFGQVYAVSSQDDSLFALKSISYESYREQSKPVLRQDREKQAMSEATRVANSNFLVKLYHSYAAETSVYLLMELCSGGDLEGLIKDTPGKILSQDLVQFYSACIILGLEALHNLDIMFRDLKPGNVFLSDRGFAKIGDFGLCTKSRRSYTFCGTTDYLAPEILRCAGHNSSVDFWALGVVIFELLCGRTPFSGDEAYQQIMAATQDMWNEESLQPFTEAQLSPECFSLINGLLAPKIPLRLGCTTEGMFAVKDHPFFDKVNWAQLENCEVEAPRIRNKLDLGNTMSRDELIQSGWDFQAYTIDSYKESRDDNKLRDVDTYLIY